jgi:hypothetical protein
MKVGLGLLVTKGERIRKLERISSFSIGNWLFTEQKTVCIEEVGARQHNLRAA